MTATTHTPTPWHQYANCGPQICAGNEQIGTTARFGPSAKVHAEDEANAAFIVTACNAHDELVAALNAIHDEADSWPDNETCKWIAKASRAALAKVGGAS